MAQNCIFPVLPENGARSRVRQQLKPVGRMRPSPDHHTLRLYPIGHSDNVFDMKAEVIETVRAWPRGDVIISLRKDSRDCVSLIRK